MAETHALRRKPIELRRPRLRIAIAAQIRAVVLARDPENIRPVGGAKGGDENADNGEEEANHAAVRNDRDQ